MNNVAAEAVKLAYSYTVFYFGIAQTFKCNFL